jgi:hypothetical protein
MHPDRLMKLCWQPRSTEKCCSRNNKLNGSIIRLVLASDLREMMIASFLGMLMIRVLMFANTYNLYTTHINLNTLTEHINLKIV